MKNNKIHPMQKYKEVSNEEIVSSILNTYKKIKNGEFLAKEDLQNIKNFYSYLVINNAIGMLSIYHKNLAYQEMQRYVGNFSYPIDVQKAFLEQYLNLLKDKKESTEDTLKFA